MKLTIEENRERIKRYSHIKPAPRWGSVRCFAKCPGTLHSCTLEKGHSGPHVAHGTFQRVVAVWDGRIKADVGPRRKPAKAVRTTAPRGSRGGGLVAALKAYRGRIVRRFPAVEEVFLLILAMSMAGFAFDWALRILGLK